MKPHRTDFYKDGFSRVEYCTVCGAEGELLRLECITEEKDENQKDFFEKEVDKPKEQS